MRRARFLIAVAVVLLAAGCSEGAAPQAPASPAAVPSSRSAPAPAAPVPSVSVVLPRGAGYGEPCNRVARLVTQWADLAVRAGESPDLADVTRAEVEELINQLAAVTPLLPPGAQPMIPDLVDPLVVLRGVLLTGVNREVVFGPGKAAIPELLLVCARH